MGLFRKSDELFELMSKSGPSGSGPRPDLGQSGTSRAHRKPATGFGPPFETTQGFGRSAIFGRPKTGPDLFEVDGEALVIVEDGFDIETGGEAKAGFSFRPDTLVVGALLTTGLLVSAFLLGRSSGPDDAPKVAIVVEESADDMEEPEGPSPAQRESAVAQQAAARAMGVQPAPQGAVIQPPAGSQAALASAPRPANQRTARTGAPTTLKASAPAPGRHELIVASTTPESAKKLAEWFKKNPLSPIYGRSDLQVVGSRRGLVSIRGFQDREGTVLKRVRATQDPLGGSGSFGDAYYRKARR